MARSLETQNIINQLAEIKRANGQVTIQDLRQAFINLVPDVTQDLANKNTLFYAGKNPTDPLYIAAKAISKDASNPLTIMGSTKFSELMHSKEVVGYLKDIAEKNKIVDYTNIMNDETTIDGVKSRALWDDASEALAKASSGDVRTLTPFGTEDKVFARVELPALIENPNVKTIDGIPREVLKTMYDADIASGLTHTEAIDNARAAVQAKSLIYTSLIDEITNANGKVTYEVSRFIDGPNNLADYNTKGASVIPHADTSIIHSTLLGDTPSTSLLNQSQIEFLNRGKTQLERVELVTQQLAQNVSTFESTHLLNLAKGVYWASFTIGALVVTANVQAAETPEQKQQIIDDWVAHTTAEWIAGSIGSALVVGGVAAFTAVSAPVTLALAIVGGIVGSIVGGDTVYDYIKNGVNALLDDIKTWWLLWEKLLSDTGMGNFEESADLDLVQEIDRGDSLSSYLNHGGLGSSVPTKSSPIMLDHIETNIHASTDTGLSEGDLAKNNFGAETVPIVEENRNNIISTDIRDKVIDGDTGNDYLVGGSGNDYLKGDYGNDLLEGGDGEDHLFGEDGDDTLIGGRGSDELEGGSGINTYIFNKGDGVDAIRSYDFYEGKSQYIAETHIILDVLPDDIWVNASADYVFLTIKNTTDQLYIKDPWNANIGLKTITFADQTVWTITDILAHPLLGTEDDDYLVNMNTYDATIYGLAGNDHLYGSIGNDYLDGGTGNDYLDGGIGDDYLDGGDGVNTYVFNRGYGDDIVNSAVGANSLPTETYILMDVLPSDISVEISYTNVFVSIDDTGDFLEILGVFQESSAFKTITFADQTVWTIQDLQNSASIDGNQDESLTDLLNGLADHSNYEEYGYLFDELPDNQSLVGQLEGNNTQVLTDSLVFEESSDVDYPFNLLTIEDMQKFNIDVDKLLRSANANSESEDTQNVKNSLIQKYQLDEVDDPIVFDNTSFSMPNNIGLWNSSFNQQFIA